MLCCAVLVLCYAMLCWAGLGNLLCRAGAVKIDRGKQRGNVCLHGETTVLGNMLCCGNVWSRARAGQAFSRLGMLLVKMPTKHTQHTTPRFTHPPDFTNHGMPSPADVKADVKAPPILCTLLDKTPAPAQHMHARLDLDTDFTDFTDYACQP